MFDVHTIRESTKVRRFRFEYLRGMVLDENIDYGVFYGGNGTQLAVQILGTIVIACWTCVISSALFWFLKKLNRLRVPDDEQLKVLRPSRPE